MVTLADASRAERRIRGADVEWGPDRWRLYGLALTEASRALRTGLARLVRPHRLLRARSPERLLFAPQDLRTSDPTVAGDIYARLFVFARRAVATGGPDAAPRPRAGAGGRVTGIGREGPAVRPPHAGDGAAPHLLPVTI